MLKALRDRSIVLVALLCLLSAASVDLCRHSPEPTHANAAEPVAAAFACDDCGDCCDAGSAGEGEHCHACLCACHSVGVLAASNAPSAQLSAAPIAAPPAPQQAAGYRRAFERPPLAS